MRFYKKDIEVIIEYKRITRKWFAWLPVTIGKETRWLETVQVTGYYCYNLYSSYLVWINENFELL